MNYSPYSPPESPPDNHAAIRPLGAKTTVASVLILLTTAAGAIQSIVNVVRGDDVVQGKAAVVGSAAVFAIVLSFIAIAAGIAFFIWVYAAAKNAWSFGQTGLEFTPGWAIGWWFIPVASLWKPYQAIKEIWRASDPDTIRSGDGLAWFTLEVPALFSIWWSTYLARQLVAIAGTFMLASARLHHDGISQAQLVIAFAHVCSIIAAVSIASIMRQIDRRQVAAARKLEIPV